MPLVPHARSRSERVGRAGRLGEQTHCKSLWITLIPLVSLCVFEQGGERGPVRSDEKQMPTFNDVSRNVVESGCFSESHRRRASGRCSTVCASTVSDEVDGGVAVASPFPSLSLPPTRFSLSSLSLPPLPLLTAVTVTGYTVGGSSSIREGKERVFPSSAATSTSPNGTRKGVGLGVAGLARQTYLEEERAEDVKAVRGASIPVDYIHRTAFF